MLLVHKRYKPTLALTFRNALLLLASQVGPVVRGLYFHDPAEMTTIQSLLGRIINDQVQVTSKETVNREATASLMSALGINKPSPPSNAQSSSTPPNPTSQPLPPHTTSHAAAPASPAAAPASPAAAPNLVLDKKGLQLTLLSLIQDDRFIDLLHAQYLKVATARAGKK